MALYDIRNHDRTARVVQLASLLADSWAEIAARGVENHDSLYVYEKLNWLFVSLGYSLLELIPLIERPDVRASLRNFLDSGVGPTIADDPSIEVMAPNSESVMPPLPGVEDMLNNFECLEDFCDEVDDVDECDSSSSTKTDFIFVQDPEQTYEDDTKPLSPGALSTIKSHLADFPSFHLSFLGDSGPPAAQRAFRFAEIAPTLVRRLLATIEDISGEDI